MKEENFYSTLSEGCGGLFGCSVYASNDLGALRNAIKEKNQKYFGTVVAVGDDYFTVKIGEKNYNKQLVYLYDKDEEEFEEFDKFMSDICASKESNVLCGKFDCTTCQEICKFFLKYIKENYPSQEK